MANSSGVNKENYVIPLEEIYLATQNLSSETLISENYFRKVYKGTLSKSRQYRTVAIKQLDKCGYYGSSCMLENELEMVCSLHHENIIPLIGYHDKVPEPILVSEYASNGSLDHYLSDSTKAYCLTWAQRLKICLGAARGLEYLHSKSVIHRNFKSANILLDENLEAKICGFGFSMLVEPKQGVYERAVGTLSYLDPIYYKSGIVNMESDVYSFGVLLFEMLNGMLAYNRDHIRDRVHPQTLINLVRNCYEDGLDKLISSDQMRYSDTRSFRVYKEIAYKCISLKLENRPTMRMIVNMLEEALTIETTYTDALTFIPPYENRESFVIPVEEIMSATGDFSPESQITPMKAPFFLAVHTGQLSERWQNRRAIFKRFDHDGSGIFSTEFDMLRRFDNENIISLIGCCRHINDSYLVHEYAANGRLYDHLSDPEKKRCLTWAKRLEICKGAARGLKYLHSGLGEHTRVMHNDVKSEIILLGDNLEAKISGFCWSKLVNPDQPQVHESMIHRDYTIYMDPIYRDNRIGKTDSDVYSFGVVLFEMLSGILAHEERCIGDGRPQKLIDLVRSYYDGGMKNLIDPLIKDEINDDSFQVFKKIAYRCISLNQNDRPTMNRVFSRIEEAWNIQNGGDSTITIRSQQLGSYLIPLTEIKLATKEFSRDTLVGEGGFGKVYKGQLSERWQNCTVAIKILDTDGCQGYKEFHTELELISSFRHKNIIPFIGYCDEDNHMIIVTEYASNHSLDQHLQNPQKRRRLTWTQRIKICLGAAKGLNYLHSGLGKDGVIHRDVKSGNILLDEHMEARICDFGLSKQNLKNQQATHMYTKAAGTHFYLDPIYHESGILRKASDVYSFGVVLFEILTGRMAYISYSLEDGLPKVPLMNLVRRYSDDKFEKLIDPLIADHFDSPCFRAFKEIACKCIGNTVERPTMEMIMEMIEDAMDF